MRRKILTGAGSKRSENSFDTRILPRPERRRIVAALVAAALLILAGSLTSKAADLNGDTLQAWEAYLKTENIRLAESSHETPFLWSDKAADRIRSLREGKTLVAPIGENPKSVHHGLIHHWIGAAFLPNIGLHDVLAVVRDYSRYKDFYAPNVIESRLEDKNGTEDAFLLRMLNKAVASKVALDGHFRASYSRIDEKRWYGIAYSTRICEIADYGQAAEHALPPDTGHGFIWRLYSVSRFEARDGGVYVELETMALSRDVPAALHWLVNPMVRRVSKGSMLVSLQKTYEAVFASNELASGTAKRRDDVAQKVTFAMKAR